MNLEYKIKKNFKSTDYFLVISLVFFIYFFIAFLPLPWVVEGGLDQSWSYAISQVAKNQMVFGRDIIFTYGPLGFLTNGAILNNSFSQIMIFRWFIYLLLFAITVLRILTLKNFVYRLFIGSSIIFAVFIGSPYIPIGVGLSTDYQILFVFLIGFSFNNIVKKYSQLVFLLLGITSGFFILTKLTLGICIFSFINLFLLLEIINSLKYKLKTDLTTSGFSMLNAFLGAASISFVFLVPSQLTLQASKIIVDFFIASTLGIFSWLWLRKIESNFHEKSKGLLIITNHSLLLSWSLFYLTYFLLLAYTIYFSPSSPIIDYLKYSLEFSSNYSSAMSSTGYDWQLVLAISELFVIVFLIFTINTKEGLLASSLPLLFVLFVSFKHGFVRQDIHVLIFAMTAPLITSLLIIKASKFRYRKTIYCLFFYMLFSSFLIAQNVFPIEVITNKLIPSEVANNIKSLTDIEKIQLSMNEKIKNNLSSIQIPNNVKILVGQKPIDIIPWEISLVPANQLNWKPRPVFQSYAAYTNTLDDKNFESLSKEERDYIFYQFQSIDNRHPFFDEPKTFSHVFCNYKPSVDIPGFIKTPRFTNMILLEKLKLSRCSSPLQGKSLLINWDDSIRIESTNNDMISASVKFHYSTIGKIVKNLFRIPPVIMRIDYTDGSQKAYRIIPENSENGVIVSHLPRNDDEAMSFFQGELPAKVKSFSFHTINSMVFTPNIEISLSGLSS
jgi:hypothetical protein